MSHPVEAVLSENSPRYQEWLEVFGLNRCPVLTVVEREAELPGIGRAGVYLLNLRALDDAQRARLVSHIAHKFEIPEREVAEEIDRVGVPILAEDVCIVFTDMRFIV